MYQHTLAITQKRFYCSVRAAETCLPSVVEAAECCSHVGDGEATTDAKANVNAHYT